MGDVARWAGRAGGCACTCGLPMRLPLPCRAGPGRGAVQVLSAAGVLAARRGARVRVFLTRLGGGAFGNSAAWIKKVRFRVRARARSSDARARLRRRRRLRLCSACVCGCARIRVSAPVCACAVRAGGRFVCTCACEHGCACGCVHVRVTRSPGPARCPSSAGASGRLPLTWQLGTRRAATDGCGRRWRMRCGGTRRRRSTSSWSSSAPHRHDSERLGGQPITNVIISSGMVTVEPV